MTTLSLTRPRWRRPLAVAAAALLGLAACSSEDPAPAAGSAAPSAEPSATPSAAPSATTAAPSSAAPDDDGGGDGDVCGLLTGPETQAFLPGTGPGRAEGPGTCTWTAPGAARTLTIRLGPPGSAPGGKLPAAATDAAPRIQGVRIGGEGRLGEIVVGDRVCSARMGTGVPAPAAAGFVVAAAVRCQERFGA